ncbi:MULTISPECIES: hypothetical protein [unclassified Kitasatospora]|uniref:hypothetical protein n=1 Tax=unclassified Kitasatospora TaxID=2633591 RepID=UPI00340AEC50
MTAHTPVRSLLADAALAVVLALALAYPAAPALADPAGPTAACARNPVDRHPVDRHGDAADPAPAGPCAR